MSLKLGRLLELLGLYIIQLRLPVVDEVTGEHICAHPERQGLLSHLWRTTKHFDGCLFGCCDRNRSASLQNSVRLTRMLLTFDRDDELIVSGVRGAILVELVFLHLF